MKGKKSSTASQSERWKLSLERAIFWSVLAVAFFTPLLVLPFTVNAFELPKVTFVRVMVVLLLVLWTARMLLFSNAAIRRTRLDLLVFLFLVLVILSTVFSVDPLTSLFGKYLRHEGMLTFLSYGLLFFMGVQVFSGKKLRTLARAAVLSASLAAIYGILQYFARDPFIWIGVVETHPFSTFGNSVLFGAFLALVFPLAFSLFLDSKNRVEELLSGVGLFIIAFTLVATFSRGSWLAGIAGTLFLLLMLMGTRVSKNRLVLAALIVLLAVVSVELISVSPDVPSQELGSRAVSALDTEQSSVRHRLLIWQTSLQGIRERPLLGYGPDSFAFMFYKLQTAEHIRAFFLSNQPFTVTDNAHNYLIQLSATLGIPAAVLALVSLLVFLVVAWKEKREREDYPIFKIGFLAGVIAYMAALLFGISTVGSTSLFWLFLGGAMSETSREGGLTWKKRSYVPRTLLFAVVGAAALALIFFNLRSFAADIYFARGYFLNSKEAFPQAARQLADATRLNPWEARYRGELGLCFFNWAQKIGGNQRLVDAAAFHLEKARGLSPYFLDNYLILGNVYRFGGMWFGKQYYALAEDRLKRAIEISPNSPDAHYLLGFVYLLQAKEKTADYHLSAAKSINPNREPVYYNLGSYFEERGEIAKAKEMYRRALKQNDDGAREALKRLEINTRP